MINKDLFCEVMEDIKKADDYQNWLNAQLQRNGVEGYLFQPTCIDSAIKLLHFCFGNSDIDDTISYFCFELNYGRKWKEGMLTGEDGRDIVLATSSDLYNYLISKSN